MKLKRLVSLALGSGVALATVGASSAQAVLVVTTTTDAATLGNTIIGSGITATNFVYTGGDIASGTFTGGTSAGIGIDQGIILTSGDANLATGPNSTGGSTGSNTALGDAQLSALAGGAGTFNASVLSFDFTSTSSDLFFNFVFASEEYPEFANTNFNDVFGFFVDGTNIALVPGTTTPITINTINNGNGNSGVNAQNPQFYIVNPSGAAGTQYDGYTTVLTAQALGLSAGSHSIKLAIADVGDASLDSAVFIQANTFAATNPTLPPTGSPTDVPEPFTIVGTLIGGTAALRMRKKLKSNDKV
ncbi:choice-of-anchor L domain-containing protein [Chamaesiphon sp.]|uniref:choice-of-anchor L domain-containing protein n=1 Tax=Chamaesiphon sp. TaxID=2814140 RepID=UPI003593B9EB